MSTLTLSFCSPAQTKIYPEIATVVIPGCEGSIGVLPRHATMSVMLEPGLVTITPEKVYFIAGGIAHITPETCLIVTDHFQRAEEADTLVLEEQLRQHHDDLAGIEIDYKRRALEEEIKILEQQIAVLRKLGLPQNNKPK